MDTSGGVTGVGVGVVATGEGVALVDAVATDGKWPPASEELLAARALELTSLLCRWPEPELSYFKLRLGVGSSRKSIEATEFRLLDCPVGDRLRPPGGTNSGLMCKYFSCYRGKILIINHMPHLHPLDVRDIHILLCWYTTSTRSMLSSAGTSGHAQ